VSKLVVECFESVKVAEDYDIRVALACPDYSSCLPKCNAIEKFGFVVEQCSLAEFFNR
jgi:hypothetical protein